MSRLCKTANVTPSHTVWGDPPGRRLPLPLYVSEAQWCFQVDAVWSKWCVGRASLTQKWLKVKDFCKNNVRENFWRRENDRCRRGRGSKMFVGTSKRKNGWGSVIKMEAAFIGKKSQNSLSFYLDPFLPLIHPCLLVLDACVQSPLVKGSCCLFPVANSTESRWEKGTIQWCWYLERPSGASLTTHSTSVIRFDLWKCYFNIMGWCWVSCWSVRTCWLSINTQL